MISNELYMFTAETIPGAPANVTFCDCDFLKWGFWGGELKPSGGTFERIHGATWVAGRIPDLADIPLTGTASYSGHVAVGVLDDGDSYFSTGNLAVVVDFGNNRELDLQHHRLRQRHFSGTGISIVSASAGHKFSGSVTGAGVHSGRSGSYLGSFIQNATATDKVVEMGGHISLTGPNYDASGTFAGAKVP